MDHTIWRDFFVVPCALCLYTHQKTKVQFVIRDVMPTAVSHTHRMCKNQFTERILNVAILSLSFIHLVALRQNVLRGAFTILNLQNHWTSSPRWVVRCRPAVSEGRCQTSETKCFKNINSLIRSFETLMWTRCSSIQTTGNGFDVICTVVGTLGVWSIQWYTCVWECVYACECVCGRVCVYISLATFIFSFFPKWSSFK